MSTKIPVTPAGISNDADNANTQFFPDKKFPDTMFSDIIT